MRKNILVETKTRFLYVILFPWRKDKNGSRRKHFAPKQKSVFVSCLKRNIYRYMNASIVLFPQTRSCFLSSKRVQQNHGFGFHTDSRRPSMLGGSKTFGFFVLQHWVGIEQTLQQTYFRGSARCVQSFDDSLDFAIRMTYRISLRSSSLWEPRHPLLKVV